MIFAIDMGNSNIKMGIVDGLDNIMEERVTTAYEKTSLEYASDMIAMMNLHNIERTEITGAILSSVVPPLTGVLVTAVRKALGIEPMIVSNELKLDIKLNKFKYPKGVGADLIVGAEAAYMNCNPPSIIINMGTATTITAVDEDGEFLGGSIMLGMKQSATALSSSTANLPVIDLNKPGKVICRDTVQSMKSGVIYGIAGGIDALIDRMSKELGKECDVVACGGMAKFAIPYCRHKIKIDDKLLMKGLLRIYDLNKNSIKINNKNA